jgi:hypothetical protein
VFHRIIVGWRKARYAAHAHVTLPDVGGYRLTWRRLFNFCLNRYVPGRQWRPRHEWGWWMNPQPGPCLFLWESPVLTSDGGIAPCRGVFLRGDDMGRLAAEPGREGATFAEIWNNERYQSSRRFFARRDGSPDERRLVCFDCPTTLCL